MLDYDKILKNYKGKKVLVTGHTGFKGSWLTYLLLYYGAEVTGFSLGIPTNPSLFEILGLANNNRMQHIVGDIRDMFSLKNAIRESRPEIIFHLAAQPIVRESYRDPVTTYSTNVMGTVNLLECVRYASSVRSVLNVTTDKVYRNNEWVWGYREIDELDGLDPYSNSKSCSELVTHSFRDSFFRDSEVSISTVRAGNVIGGGDFAQDRIIPDCIRALMNADNGKASIEIRNPQSIRPYQHVLEPIFAYMMIAISQYEDKSYVGCYNVGPNDEDCISTGKLVNLFCDLWNENGYKNIITLKNKPEKKAPHEAEFLKLDCSKMKSVFGWQPKWSIREAVEYTIDFTRTMFDKNDIENEMRREIQNYTHSKI